MTQDVELPELPEPVGHKSWPQSLTGEPPFRVPLFTEDQMRAYAAAALLAERERHSDAANKSGRLRSHILAGLQREASFAEQLAERDRDADRLLEALREAMHQATEYDGLDLATIGPQHWYTKAAAIAASMAKPP